MPANKPAGFTYQLPFISSITPDKGKPGEAITIKGGAFSSVPEVYIGNYVLLITHYTRGEINCIIPRQTPALTGNVRVISDGCSVVSETSFEIIR